MPTSFDSIFFVVAGPSLLCYCLRSPVLTAPVRGSTPTLCCPVANCSRLGPSSTACQLLCPANSHSRPLTTSRYGEISGPRILCLVSRQNRKRNRLLWGGHPHSATHYQRMNDMPQFWHQIALMLYSHMQIHLHIHAEHILTQWIKTSEDFFRKIYLSLYLKGSCVREGVGDRTELQYIDSHSYGHQRCVFLVLQGCSTGGPALCWMMFFLPHLVSNGSGL